MSDSETLSHTFVIRIWLEKRDPPTWRGHVTHATTGERSHFSDLQELAAIIAGYLRTEESDGS